MSEEILIVDDNVDIRTLINELILDAGYKTRVAANYNQALGEIDKKLPDVAILDVKLDKGDNDGIELLSHIKSKNKDIPVIIISGHANIEMAIKSLHHGAFEFIEKPFDQERLLNFISRAVEHHNLKKQNEEYENKLFSSYDLIGDSKNTLNIKDQINKISLTESRVFIQGPSGSGKELVARKIHKKSSRNQNSFIVLKSDENLPDFASSEIEEFKIDTKSDIDLTTDYVSMYLNLGKKNKINKVDIVGLFYKKGGLINDELGKIEVLDYCAYIAVKRSKSKQLMDNLRGNKIKKQSFIVAVSR